MRKIGSVLLFCALLAIMISGLNDIFVEKINNRYYMMDKYLDEIEEIDVQVYGSCHAYTSFDTLYFTRKTGLSSFNTSNPSEIIPTTYLRMKERFKKDIPEMAIVEIWGVNAYDTYLPKEETFGDYFRNNVAQVSFSKDKVEVIRDYEELDMLEENIPLLRYKDRLLKFGIKDIDFNYVFENTYKYYKDTPTQWVYGLQQNRYDNNGFRTNKTAPVLDYPDLQQSVSDDEVLEVEEDLLKYLDKIIELCKENDVELIFYRSPYISNQNELRKVNFLKKHFAEKDVLFFDMEEEVEFDYSVDFLDYEHLSAEGGRKLTKCFIEKVEEAGKAIW